MMRRLRDWLGDRIAALPPAARLDPAALLARDAPGGLARPGRASANRHCRLLRARDGWVALNLARAEDREAVPALTHGAGDGWAGAAALARTGDAAAFRDAAVALQLPVALPGEAAPLPLAAPAAGAVPRRVLDLSALWAGPLCAGLLARAGAEVIRIDSVGRPDPVATASPALDHRLNGGKARVALDLRDAGDRARLIDLVMAADVLVTSARPAALARLGLERQAIAAAHPRLIWAAITAHGQDAPRVGFGDDCAVAGGLLRWRAGTPGFIGDALADPLTGVEAALAVLHRADAGPESGGQGGLIDMAMARVAASCARAIA